MNRRPPVHAFSLVEILVVIAIIALLAATAIPVFNSVTAQGKSAKCIGNLRAIGAAAFAYAQDNDGRLPPIAQSYNWNAANAHRWWMSFLYDYGTTSTNVVDVRKIWRCPAVTDDEFRKDNAIVYSSYTAFRPIVNYVSANNPSGSYKLMQIQKPSVVWMFGDGGKPVGDSGVDAPPEKYLTAAAMARYKKAWDAAQGKPAFRHSGNTSAHYVACDGHVESLSWEKSKDVDCGPFGYLDSNAGEDGGVVY